MNKKILLKYPKLLLLFFTFLLAYLLFYGRIYQPFNDFITSTGYIGTFLAGILYVYGFTAAPATAILLILAKEQNIFLAGFIAGFGALTGDLLIFKFIRWSFADEIEKLSKEKLFNHFNNKPPKLFKKYLIPVLAGVIIASPLPDEIGVTLLAGATKISTKMFSAISYVLNTSGIFVVLIIGNML